MPPEDEIPVVKPTPSTPAAVLPPTGVEDPKPKGDPAPKVEPKVEPLTSKEKDITKKILNGEEPDEDLEQHADEKGYLTMPIRALRTRIARASKAVLKEWLGTEDRVEARKKLDVYEAAVKDREEERRNKLAENDRLKEDNAKEKARADAAEAKIAAREFEREVTEVEEEVLAAAKVYVDDDKHSLKAATSDFKEHVRELDKKELKALEKGDAVEKWFEKWAKENPKHALSTEKKPIDNGAKTKDKKVAKVAGSDNGKSVKDMSEFEYKQHLKARGIHT